MCIEITPYGSTHDAPEFKHKTCYSRCNSWPSDEFETPANEKNTTFTRAVRLPSNGPFVLKAMVVEMGSENQIKIMGSAKPIAFFVNDTSHEVDIDCALEMVENESKRFHIRAEEMFCSRQQDGGASAMTLLDARRELCWGPVSNIRARYLEDLTAEAAMDPGRMCIWTNVLRELRTRSNVRMLHTTGLENPGEVLWLLEFVLSASTGGRITIAGREMAPRFETIVSGSPNGFRQTDILYSLSPSNAMLVLLNTGKSRHFDVIVLESDYMAKSNMMRDMLFAWSLLRRHGVLIIRDSLPRKTHRVRWDVVSVFLSLFDDDDSSGERALAVRRCEDTIIVKLRAAPS